MRNTFSICHVILSVAFGKAITYLHKIKSYQLGKMMALYLIVSTVNTNNCENELTDLPSAIIILQLDINRLMTKPGKPRNFDAMIAHLVICTDAAKKRGLLLCYNSIVILNQSGFGPHQLALLLNTKHQQVAWWQSFF